MTPGEIADLSDKLKRLAALLEQTVDLDTLEPASASKERSDVCAVPACAVVAEGEVAFVLANAYLEKFGHDNMADIRTNLASYKQRLKMAAR